LGGARGGGGGGGMGQAVKLVEMDSVVCANAGCGHRTQGQRLYSG